MQIDRQSLDKLLKLNDRQLLNVVNKLAADSGIDLASLGVNTDDVRKIRSALGSATDDDIEKAARLYEERCRRGQ